MALPLSVCIITKNEEANIRRTLESIRDIASEIIIVDSGSTDKTIEIAQEFNSLFFTEEWKGFVAQKNSALAKCSQPWILCLDADEVPSDDFKKSLIEKINLDSPFSYEINIKSFYLGKLLNHCWQPERKLRLVRKDASPRWHGGEVHESIQVNNAVLKIAGIVVHYSYRDREHHIQKMKNYSLLSAKAMFNSGRKFNYFNLIFNPTFNFIKMYFLQLGFLDGVPGFIASIISSYGTYLKYRQLRKLRNSE